MASESATVSLSCLCGLVAQEVELNPLATSTALSLCHCDICRATSGLLFVSYLPLSKPPELSAGLCSYSQTGDVRRWFCSRCGAHVFAQTHHTGEYYVALGLITDINTNRPIKHYGVGDTQDGGLSVCLSGDHCPQACILSRDDAGKYSDARPPNNRINARCHCGGVSFQLSRPDETSTQVSSPWSDVLVPYHSHSSANPEDVKWWLRADQTKYLAGTCACRSCRLASGFPIQTWAFVPKTNIFWEDGSPLSFGTGTMQQYESKPGIFREFCRTCGATIFWHCLERPGVIDVSVGLLKSSTGARAEDWLDWATDRVSFAEDGIDKELVEELQSGLKQLNK